MTQLDIDPELFYEAAGAYSRASTEASKALEKMDADLRSAIKMSGGDPGGTEWGAKYVVSGTEAVVTASQATDALFRMAALLRQSGVNHDQSEEAESYNQSGGPLPDADPGGKTFFARPLKNPAGGTRPEPFGWALVMGDVEWIDGNTERLQQAAASWTIAAGIYQALDNGIKPKMKQLMTSTAPELPDAEQANTLVLDGMELLADAMRQQGGATSGYADVLKAAQEGIEWELQLQTVAQAINIVNAATVGKPIERLILEAAEKEIEYSRNKIRGILDGLANARNLTITILSGVSTTVTSSINTKFAPILQKQLKRPPEPTKRDQARENRARGARAEARAGIDPTKPKTSIPSQTGATRRIPDDLDRENRRLAEVKNVQHQAYTDQIKDYVLYTQNMGYRFDLVVDNRTTVDPEIQKLASQGKINIIRLDLNS